MPVAAERENNSFLFSQISLPILKMAEQCGAEHFLTAH